MNTNTVQDVAAYLRSRYGAQAAAAYEQICSYPVNPHELKRDFSDSETLLTRLCEKKSWTTKEICKSLGWTHTKTSQTIQYLIREGKATSRQIEGSIYYRKASEKELQYGLQLELKGVA